MKVLTYSSSASIINRAAEGLERLEIVFGRPDILGDMASYLHFQELLLKELIDATRGKDFIKERGIPGADACPTERGERRAHRHPGALLFGATRDHLRARRLT